MKTAIMIIWFGTGHIAQFDTERFNSLQECLLARQAVLVEAAKSDRWTKPGPDDVTCTEI